MYASAGAAEEAFSPQGGGAAEVLPRVGREVFSGLPGVQGDKREFIEVMERAGVPEMGHLSDVVGPFTPVIGGLVGPGKFDPTGRGMAGFAADVLLDPTTYITAGGSTVGRFATAKGVINLNKRGLAVKDAIVGELGPTYRLLDEAEDAVLRETGRRQVREVLENRVSIAVKQDPSLLQKTGLKVAGMEVVSPRLVKNVTEPVKQMLGSAPWGARAARVASEWGDGVRKHFDAFADLAHLDDSAREGVKNKMREYQSAIAASNHRDAQAWDVLRADEAKLARRYGNGDAGVQALGKKFTDWREGTGTPVLTPAEEDLFKRAAANYDARGEVNVRNGVISGEQFDKYQGKYVHHDYKNKEVLSETMARQAVADGLLPAARVNKERQFETIADAVRVSRELAAEGKLARERGAVRQMYGELIPEYSISKNLWSHIEQSNRSVFQKKLLDDLQANYGLKLDEFYDPSVVREIHEPIHVPEADSKIIDDLMEGKNSVSHKEWVELPKDVRATLPMLSDGGKRELARQLLAKSRDESHVLRVRDAVGENLMPPVKALKEGDINPFFLKHGLPEGKARLVTRGGGLWGDQPHLVPQAIADMLDDAPKDMLADAHGKLGPITRLVDKVGNAFKGITYPGYPSGAFRDTYNNLQQGFLALGVQSLTRPDIAARIRLGGDGIIDIGALRKTAAQWKKLSEEIRVVDPSAASFVQTTGKQGAEKASLYAKARAIRGQFDNGTRTQLWAAGMRMGMTPEDSARMVQEFLYNYAELAPFQRDVLRRAFPFIVFPLKTIKLYPGVIARTPGRLANLHKLFQGRDSENQQMTTWEGEGYKIRLDRDGKNITMLNGVDLPVRSFDMLWSGGWGKSLERLVGSANPIPKILYMMGSHRDPFRGKEMTRASFPTLGRIVEAGPQWLKDLSDYKKKFDNAGRPIYTFNEEKVRVAFEISMTSRIFSMSDKYFRDQVNEPGAPNWWLALFTGLQKKTLNLDEEQKKRLDSLKKIAEEEAVKQGELQKFQKYYKKGQ
jgi:hypothetical protein